MSSWVEKCQNQWPIRFVRSFGWLLDQWPRFDFTFFFIFFRESFLSAFPSLNSPMASFKILRRLTHCQPHLVRFRLPSGKNWVLSFRRRQISWVGRIKDTVCRDGKSCRFVVPVTSSINKLSVSSVVAYDWLRSMPGMAHHILELNSLAFLVSNSPEAFSSSRASWCCWCWCLNSVQV